MIESMDELESRVRRQVNRMLDLTEAMVAVRVRETSPDGAVAVEVDGNGALVDLSLSHAVTRMTPEDFERVLVDTCNTAAARAFSERSRLIVGFNEEAAERFG
ncbi:YbaB/EbfC family nucleoid-associated protein [Nocardia sp. NPDC050406]|uniref:YbaB/EbfC family nucleoid-associated protein n=1 Tax=Nocardia sp. NPDC050406 TaxID=3364318 RepID=UPI0037A18D25